MKYTEKLKLQHQLKTAVFFVTAGGLTFHVATNDHHYQHRASAAVPAVLPDSLKSLLHGVLRSSRAISTIASTVADYKYSLRGIPEDSDEFARKLSEVHLRSAKRIRKLCEANKGFYIKAGQFVAALRQVPAEYSSTLSSLQDQVVPLDFKAIKAVLIQNLGQQDLSKIFLKLDEKPIAAASIAQVHHATLKDHREVAIKVQYPGLEDQMKIDITTMSLLSKSISWLFPDYRFGWLISEFKEVISSELDFIQEARNSERTAKNFRRNKKVKVPDVYWEWTTDRVLTMQFCPGCKVDDVGFLKEMGIDPVKVGRALVEIFAEMIFVHGYVHGDPHPGNILIAPGGRYGFTLVLLDHGIYIQLDEGFRRDYCQLWKALILSDSDQIEQISFRFGIGKYSRYLPVIFTGRTIDGKRAVGAGMSDEEKKNLKQELKSIKMEDIFAFMESLPPDFLTILRTDGLLRFVIRKLNAPQHVRLLAYAKYALYGLSQKSNHQSEYSLPRLKAHISYLQLRLTLGVLGFLYWMNKVNQHLCNLCRRIVSATMVL